VTDVNPIEVFANPSKEQPVLLILKIIQIALQQVLQGVPPEDL
jgi:hypothetical protein